MSDHDDFVPQEVDQHSLDTCECGGVLDHWKMTTERKGIYYCTWLCRKCGDYSDRYDNKWGQEVNWSYNEDDL